MGFKNNHSPLRYPGGKAILANFLADVISQNNMTTRCVYCEPYAGGAGAAITLLKWGAVSRIMINEYDPCISAFWKSILHDTEKFITRIETCHINIEEWKRQRAIYNDSKNIKSRLDVGFATFYLNRCNRSGILPKAGPIGGRKQNGKYRLSARFKKDVLIARIMDIVALKDRIDFLNLDAMEFLCDYVMRSQNLNNTLVYLDPPYYTKGQDLYQNAYKPGNHIALANFLTKVTSLKWIMSYDNVTEIKKLYNKFYISPLEIQYSAQNLRIEQELLITPKQTKLPQAYLEQFKKEEICV